MNPDTHQIARQQLEAQVDGLLGPDEARALERHLNGCPDCRLYASRLDALEQRLSISLEKRWPKAEGPPDLASLLTEIDVVTRRNPMQKSQSQALPALAWIGLVALIVLVITFSVRSLVPEQAAQPAVSQLPATLNAPAIPATDAPEPTPDSNPTITATSDPPVSGQAALFPQVEFSFVNPLPVSPDPLSVYRQALDEALTPENALTQAEALGLTGRVFAQPSEGMNDNLYMVTDGYGLVRFLNFPTQFLYWPANTGLVSQHGELPPFEQQAAAAAAFLQARGLLDEPYRAEPLEGERGGVNFLRLLDGLPVIHGIGVNRSLIGYNQVVVDPQGQVLQLTHSQPDFELLGQFPILSAGQAWERLSQENALQRSRFAVLDPQIPDTYQTWVRELPLNQPLDLYGYPDVMAPAAGDPTPLVLFRDYPAQGNHTGMQPGNFLHVWGRLVEIESGLLVLQIEGWDLSELEDLSVVGVLTRGEATAGELVSEDGSNLTLMDLPADLPDGTPIEARGVMVDGVLDWSHISTGEISSPYGTYFTCGGGGGGGSGGGPLVSNFGEGQLALPNLSGQPVAATPEPDIPGRPAIGSSLESVSGMAYIQIHQYADSSQMEVNLILDAGVLGEFPAYLRLEGHALQGIEAYHNLPVRIWGQVLRHENYQAVVQVERFEPAYPGLAVQAWLGAQEVLTLEARQVVLFTAQDGGQYVLRSSLLHGIDAMVGRPGDPVIYEGVAIPGESFGGYPLLRELAGSLAGEISDLSQYTLSQNMPGVIDETQTEGGQRLQLSGMATIVQVELAYAAISTNHCTAADAANPDIALQLLVQPIWRYMGTFEDGRRIEIQVLALPEAYYGP